MSLRETLDEQSGPNYIAEQLWPLAFDVERLSTLPGNPRRGDVEAIARSLREFGQRKPIVATSDGVVIAGNHTLHAARQLGWPQLAVVFVRDDERTARAFALADNRTGDLGAYDEQLLAALLQDVFEDARLFDASGYTEADLAKLLNGPDFDGDASPELGVLTYSIIVACNDESHQADLLERFEQEGLDCRPIAQ